MFFQRKEFYERMYEKNQMYNIKSMPILFQKSKHFVILRIIVNIDNVSIVNDLIELCIVLHNINLMLKIFLLTETNSNI